MKRTAQRLVIFVVFQNHFCYKPLFSKTLLFSLLDDTRGRNPRSKNRRVQLIRFYLLSICTLRDETLPFGDIELITKKTELTLFSIDLFD